MRLLIALLVLFAGFVGYGAYRQRQVKLVQLSRAAALQDSLHRADSLQRQAEAEAEEAAQIAARRAAATAAARQYERTRSDRPEPLKIPRPKTKYVVMKPGPTNRHR